MRSIILATFAFLGWAWFELSGGMDFTPGQHGVTVLAAVERDSTSTQEIAATADVIDVSVRADVTLDPFGVPEETVVTRQNTLDPATTGPILTSVIRPEPEPTGLISAAMAQPQAAVVTDAAYAAPDPQPVTLDIDLRVVTGSRVNLRSGPGTANAVLTQLLRGEEVEVLTESNDGWVELRALDGDDVGWMSDAFLTALN